jgi:hypothetical protein
MVFVDAIEIDAVCGFQHRIGDVSAKLENNRFSCPFFCSDDCLILQV